LSATSIPSHNSVERGTGAPAPNVTHGATQAAAEQAGTSVDRRV